MANAVPRRLGSGGVSTPQGIGSERSRISTPSASTPASASERRHVRTTTSPVESVEVAPGSPQTRLRVIGYWGPVCAYAAFIFYLSSQSFFPDTLPSFIQKLGDKVHHMMAYGLFGLLWYRAFRYCSGSWAAPRAILLAVLASALYGITDEVHQSFVPLREPDPWDVAADTLGAAAAVLAMDRWILRRTVSSPIETQA
jgi:VanZ family protein